ncbi:hypothetical protein D3C73_1517150 [compost metagenome]
MPIDCRQILENRQNAGHDIVDDPATRDFELSFAAGSKDMVRGELAHVFEDRRHFANFRQGA